MTSEAWAARLSSTEGRKSWRHRCCSGGAGRREEARPLATTEPTNKRLARRLRPAVPDDAAGRVRRAALCGSRPRDDVGRSTRSSSIRGRSKALSPHLTSACYNVAGQVRSRAHPGTEGRTRRGSRVHGTTSAQYQTEFNTYVGQGYRLVVVDGYESGGQARYAAIWEQNTGPAWVARHGMTRRQYQTRVQHTGRALGLPPDVRSRATASAATDYYAAIWEKTTGPAWVARHGMTSAQYQTEFNTLRRPGLPAHPRQRLRRRRRRTATPRSGRTTTGPAWVARHRMTSQGYQHEFVDRSSAGLPAQAGGRLRHRQLGPLHGDLGGRAELRSPAATAATASASTCDRFADELEASLQGQRREVRLRGPARAARSSGAPTGPSAPPPILPPTRLHAFTIASTRPACPRP